MTFPIRLTALLLALGCGLSIANADPVTVDFRPDISVSGGVNSGGLDTGASSFANGDPELNLAITVTNAATMSSFDGLLTVTGTGLDAAGNASGEVNVIDSGGVNFGSGNGQTSGLQFSLSGLTETTSTGSTIVFDGISFARLGNSGFDPDSNINVGTFDLGSGANVGADGTLAAGFNNGTTLPNPFNDGADGFDIQLDAGGVVILGVELAFTVTPPAVIPEPSSLALLGLCGVAIAQRRRRS